MLFASARKRIAAFALALIAPIAAASQPAAICGSLKGHSYYHYSGLVPKGKSGFAEDAVTGGRTTLQVLSKGEFDILMIDARQQVISYKQDGARILLLRKGTNDATFLVAFPGAVIELYSFYKENDGSVRFDVLSSKGGDSMPIHKSGVMTGTCTMLDLSIVE